MAGNSYEMTGTIKLIAEPQTFPSGFTKREFVVTSEEDYPQHVKIECIKDRCALLDGLKEGDRVTVRFNLRGSEYNGRYFVNLQAWRITRPEGEAGDGKKAPEDDLEPADEAEGVDGIPF